MSPDQAEMIIYLWSFVMNNAQLIHKWDDFIWANIQAVCRAPASLVTEQSDSAEKLN